MFSPLHGVQSFRLANGLRVYLKEQRDWPVVSLQAWVRVGSLDEVQSQSGISHILEHMLFKGTAHHRAKEISRWVESLGGAMNAETSKEYTHYYIDVPQEGAKQASHLMGELLSKATLEESEWAKEQPVIIEEIKRRNDDPDAQLWDFLNEALFDDPRWQRPVIGTPDTVQSISARDLRGFYKAHYTADEIVVTVVGDFKVKEMLAWLRRDMSSLPSGGTPGSRVPESKRREPRTIRFQKPVQQSYSAFGFQTPPSDHEDHEALDLVATVLGDGRYSRLVHTLREEKKLVWSIGASNLTHEGPGIFAIFAECDSRKRAALEKALALEWRRLRRSPPSAEELQRGKNMIMTSWWQSFETVHSQASTIGLFALEHGFDRLERYMDRIHALTRDDLEDVIERYFVAPMASAVIEA